MKKLTLLFSMLFICLISFGQSDNFEGKVTFDFSYEGADVSAYDFYLQKQSVYYFKDKDVRFEMIGGMASLMGSVLMDGDERIAYTINDLQKTAYIMDRDTSDNQTLEKDPNITITDTGIIEEIYGYKCKKYKVVDAEEGTVLYIWLTTELSFTNPEEYGGAAAGLFFPDTEGVMLKMESSMDMGDGTMLTVTQEVSSIDETTQDATLFRIPADYEIKEFDPTAAFGAGQAGY
ncbi:MAG: DUF4412 domain-containing protein [Crocinitomicaceae bacterium]